MCSNIQSFILACIHSMLHPFLHYFHSLFFHPFFLYLLNLIPSSFYCLVVVLFICYFDNCFGGSLLFQDASSRRCEAQLVCFREEVLGVIKRALLCGHDGHTSHPRGGAGMGNLRGFLQRAVRGDGHPQFVWHPLHKTTGGFSEEQGGNRWEWDRNATQRRVKSPVVGPRVPFIYSPYCCFNREFEREHSGGQ